MSQAGSLSSSSGPIGPNIEEILGDSGSITGNVVTIYANNASLNSGSTVSFVNSGTISTMNVSDSNFNTLIGNGAGIAGITGTVNASLGAFTLRSLTTGSFNSAFGEASLSTLTTGNKNTAVGNHSLFSNVNGSFNTAIGEGCLGVDGSGSNNTCMGWQSGGFINGGSDNTLIGYDAGSVYNSTQSSNIILGENTGVITDSNVIRIGTQGSGSGQQNQCFIAGIVGVTTSNTQIVTINSSTGQLGVVAASGFTWTDVTGSTQTITVENGYLTDNAGGVTYTLPASASIGDTFKIVGKLGLSTITPRANQQLLIGSASGTVGATGTAVATNVGDCIEFVVITAGASTIWRASSFVGNWTLS